MEVSNGEAEESDGKLLRARIVVVGARWFGEDWAKKAHPDDWRTAGDLTQVKLLTSHFC